MVARMVEAEADLVVRRGRAAVTGFVAALGLVAVPCAAQAAPAGVITSYTTLKFDQKGVLELDG